MLEHKVCSHFGKKIKIKKQTKKHKKKLALAHCQCSDLTTVCSLSAMEVRNRRTADTRFDQIPSATDWIHKQLEKQLERK